MKKIIKLAGIEISTENSTESIMQIVKQYEQLEEIKRHLNTEEYLKELTEIEINLMEIIDNNKIINNKVERVLLKFIKQNRDTKIIQI